MVVSVEIDDDMSPRGQAEKRRLEKRRLLRCITSDSRVRTRARRSKSFSMSSGKASRSEKIQSVGMVDEICHKHAGVSLSIRPSQGSKSSHLLVVAYTRL